MTPQAPEKHFNSASYFTDQCNIDSFSQNCIY